MPNKTIYLTAEELKQVNEQKRGFCRQAILEKLSCEKFIEIQKRNKIYKDMLDKSID